MISKLMQVKFLMYALCKTLPNVNMQQLLTLCITCVSVIIQPTASSSRLKLWMHKCTDLFVTDQNGNCWGWISHIAECQCRMPLGGDNVTFVRMYYCKVPSAIYE